MGAAEANQINDEAAAEANRIWVKQRDFKAAARAQRNADKTAAEAAEAKGIYDKGAAEGAVEANRIAEEAAAEAAEAKRIADKAAAEAKQIADEAAAKEAAYILGPSRRRIAEPDTGSGTFTADSLDERTL